MIITFITFMIVMRDSIKLDGFRDLFRTCRVKTTVSI